MNDEFDESFVKPKNLLGTRSVVDLKRYSNISQLYRSCLHSLGTRSAIEFLKVFTTSLHLIMKTWKTIKMVMLAAGRTMDMIYTKRSKRSRRSRWNIKAWAAASKERSKYIGAIVHHRNSDIVRKGPYTTSIHQKVNKRILLFSQQNEKCVSFDNKILRQKYMNHHNPKNFVQIFKYFF